MGNFEGLVGKFIIATLLIFSVFSFIIVTQSKNSAPQPITENAIFNNSFSSMIEKIDSGTAGATEKYGTFNSEEPQPSYGSIILFGIVSVGKSFSTIMFDFFGALIKLPLIVLGIPATVYSLLISWLIIIIIVAAWVLYKIG